MRTQTLMHSLKDGFNVSPDPSLDSDSTVLFVFGASEYRSETKSFNSLKEMFPNSLIIGCSSSGEIFHDRVYDNSLSIGIIKFEKTKIKVASSSITSMSESFKVGDDLSKKLVAPNLKGIFVLADGLTINGSDFVAGMRKDLSPEVVVTGGLAGDGSDFKETWVLKDGLPSSGQVTAIGFYGDYVHLDHGSQGGWDIFGPERIVTKSKANVVYELDGEPILKLYKEYLGEKAAGLPATALLFPLQIRPNEREKHLVRTIMAIDEENQSLTFAGNVPEGSMAQLMRANFERLIDGASSAAEKISEKKVGLAIAISCVGRRLVLGERIDEETEATLEKLPEGTQQIGFYSYGEISPFVKGDSCELHNQTMTLTTITEDDGNS